MITHFIYSGESVAHVSSEKLRAAAYPCLVLFNQKLSLNIWTYEFLNKNALHKQLSVSSALTDDPMATTGYQRSCNNVSDDILLTDNSTEYFRAGVLLDFSKPIRKTVERRLWRDVVDKDKSVRASVIALSDWSKPLLACRVPDL